jgi:hypothetical protein
MAKADHTPKKESGMKLPKLSDRGSVANFVAKLAAQVFGAVNPPTTDPLFGSTDEEKAQHAVEVAIKLWQESARQVEAMLGSPAEVKPEAAAPNPETSK